MLKYHCCDIGHAIAEYIKALLLLKSCGTPAAEGSYKWLLYGDDDTVFFLDNIIAMLSTLDHNQPYLLSDCLWWPEGGHGRLSQHRMLDSRSVSLLTWDETLSFQIQPG